MNNSYPMLLGYIMSSGERSFPRGEEIKELMHTGLYIGGTNLYAWPKVRPLDKIVDYAYKELAWYMSGERSAVYIQDKAQLWAKIKNPDGTLNSNYGYLIYYHKTPHPSLGEVTETPFQWALNSLIKDRDSRQAMVTYNTGGYNYHYNYDYICSQHQAFFIRNNVLRCFIALRSSDAIWGLPYNKIWWSLVHQNMYLHLKDQYPDLKLGLIEVDIYSAHIYKKHYDLVQQMIREDYQEYFFELKKKLPLFLTVEEYLKLLPEITEIKKIK